MDIQFIFQIVGINDMKTIFQKRFKNASFICMVAWIFFIESAFAGSSTWTIGDVASQITGSFEQLSKLITAGSYLAGLGFSIGAIMKFKQHKDNPTQIPVGTPIALLFIAGGLLFLPSILDVTSITMFGTTGGTVAGPTGIIFS